jgi:hypothetical protein
MTKETYFVHDAEIDKINIVELTEDEQKKLDEERQQAIKDKKQVQVQNEQNAIKKLEVLNRLGITADEAVLLLS